jgi:ribosomal protein S18 acetylase RimI-like enzyme
LETATREPVAFDIRPLTREDAPAWRALRLEALTNHPEAFSMSHEEFRLLDAEAVASRIPLAGGDDVLFGVFERGELGGCAGFAREVHLKGRHKGLMWGVYLRPNLRGRGVGEALVDRVIAHARGYVEILKCSVNPENLGARALYLSRGFEVYGREPKALRASGRDHDEELLALILPTG